MEKLPMCRICLAENVGMFKVINRNLHELYEKLTDMPFVTEDSRPVLACFFCCAKLKQCYRLLRQCLEAEELFAQMMNEDYENNPLITQDHLKFFSGFIKSPIVHISIDDECQTEIVAIKEELPAVYEGLDDIIKPKEEHRSGDLELDNLDNSCLDDADLTPYHSESELVDGVPLMEFKIEVEEEQEVSKNKRRARETKNENLDNSCVDVADIPQHHSESDSEDDLPLMEFKTEVEEVSQKKRRTRETKRAIIAKQPKLDARRTELEDAATAEQTKEDKSTQQYRSKPGTCFKEPNKMIQHTLTQIGERPYKCDVCSHSFKIKCALTNHSRIHTGEKPFKCDICQNTFRLRSTLRNHIRIHTDEKPYKCDVCQRSFREKSNLKTHFRTHSGEKPYKCDACQRSFSYRNNLTEHIRTHSSEKPFKCDTCERSFRHRIALIKHFSIHTGEKPYKCDICQRSFRIQGNLTQHISIHTGEKRFKCYVCQRSFRRKLHLKRHSLTHTGEKP